MDPKAYTTDEDKVLSKVTKDQLQQFTGEDPRVSGIELPKGVMLRYNLSSSLYFFLETDVIQGKIRTGVLAGDSPYDKTNRVLVGEVRTAMFEKDANAIHSKKVEQMVHDWVRFVSDDGGANPDQPFTSFSMDKET